MNIVQDYSAGNQHHGYTRLSGGTVYYWVVDGGEFSWREGRVGSPHSKEVAEKTRQWVSDRFEEVEF